MPVALLFFFFFLSVQHIFRATVVSLLFSLHVIFFFFFGNYTHCNIATSCLLAYLLLQVPHRRTTMRIFICAIPCGNLESAFRETPEPETADG